MSCTQQRWHHADVKKEEGKKAIIRQLSNELSELECQILLYALDEIKRENLESNQAS